MPRTVEVDYDKLLALRGENILLQVENETLRASMDKLLDQVNMYKREAIRLARQRRGRVEKQ